MSNASRLSCLILGIIYLCLVSCDTSQRHPIQTLESELKLVLSEEYGEFAIAFKDLHTSETLFIDTDKRFHAASTMKTPVMIEVYRQAGLGYFSLSDSILVKNQFYSIVDSSTYALNPEDDSDQELYKIIGHKRSIYDLVYDMIIVSSNLATNLVIELVEAKKVTATMRSIGADSIQVLRGVEDSKAYEAGLSNTTTANDMMVIYENLIANKFCDSIASQQMIKILLDQKFNEIIPALLPKDVKVAHKTGVITALHHDTGIVFLPNGREYILILLSKNLKDFDKGTTRMAEASKLVYDYVVRE